MRTQRFLLHLLFWLFQYGVNLYTELYLSASFSRHPSALLFFQTALAVSLPLLVTVCATYYLLYWLLPHWISNYRRPAVYAEGLALVLLTTLGIRFMLLFVVWPLVYAEPVPELSITQWVARYFYSLLGLLQVMALATAIRLFKLRVQILKKEQELTQEQMRSELQHLKAQLHPHFLFNTINSIYSLARRGASHTAEAVMQLSGILRYVLYETAQKTIPLRAEINAIKDYIELQQLRFGTRLSTRVEEHLDDPHLPIAPLLLLPLVENAYKHGSEEGGEIHIYIWLKKHDFVFRISNPAIVEKESSEGIGLSNVRRRLQLLYRTQSLRTDLKKAVFSAELRLAIDSYVNP